MSDLQYEEWRKKCEQEIKCLQSKVAKHILLAQKYSSERDQIIMALNTVTPDLPLQVENNPKNVTMPQWNFFPARSEDE